ncbi:MAG: adenylate/guanylate cyclase domain-containing protein [Verrucomicrobiales bacterium]
MSSSADHPNRPDAAKSLPRTGLRPDFSRPRHDLRTPINHILGYCEMLQEDDSVPADFLDDLKKIHGGGRQLLSLIKDYFDEETFAEKRPSLHGLYHELRTPVNHIVGYTELLEELADERALAHLMPDLGKIKHAAFSWLGLMEEYLISPQLQAGPGGAAPTPMSGDFLRPEVGYAVPIPVGALASLTQHGRLLVVDDDAANRDMLARRLARMGHQVDSAGSGLEALQLLRTKEFDLVLLDLVMPGLDGYQVLTKIKSESALAEIRVIILSALDQETSVVRCIEAGADDYIAKPFNPVFLRARIAACLEKKRLRDRERHHLAQIEAEREKSDRLLLNVLPRSIAERLKQGEDMIAESFSDVTVLFADIVGFTSLSRDTPPLRLVNLLNEVFSEFDVMAAELGLEKIKTIGDAYMVVAGVPIPRVDHAEAVGHLALRMREEILRINSRQALGLSVRIGIHSGPVIAGIIGRTKFSYDLWGDTVNTASRMESSSLPSEIQVSATTYHRLREKFRFEVRGPIEVKGLGTMETWFLKSLASDGL